MRYTCDDSVEYSRPKENHTTFRARPIRCIMPSSSVHLRLGKICIPVMRNTCPRSLWRRLDIRRRERLQGRRSRSNLRRIMYSEDCCCRSHLGNIPHKQIRVFWSQVRCHRRRENILCVASCRAIPLGLRSGMSICRRGRCLWLFAPHKPRTHSLANAFQERFVRDTTIAPIGHDRGRWIRRGDASVFRAVDRHFPYLRGVGAQGEPQPNDVGGN